MGRKENLANARNIFSEIMMKISNDKEEWKEFLKFSSKFYKYSFTENLLMYAQNKDVTMCATLEEWNSIGRWVKPKSQSLKILKDVENDTYLEYVFDVKDTYARSDIPNAYTDEKLNVFKWNANENETIDILKEYLNYENAETLRDKVKEKDERIKELEALVQKQNKLIKYDEMIIGKLTEKIKKLHELTITAKTNLSALGNKINAVATRANRLGITLEGEEKKSIFKIITDRIKSAFSKTPLLPPPSKECHDIYEESMNIDGACNNFRFGLQEYDETKNHLEIKNILDERKGLKEEIYVTRNVNAKDIDERSGDTRDSNTRNTERKAKAGIGFQMADDRDL